MTDLAQGSLMAKMIYGSQLQSKDAWMNYAKALLTIAGADGEVAPAEMDWLKYDFLAIVDTQSESLEELFKFDYINADLNELLSGISFDLPIKYTSALLYDAIRMSRADNVYAQLEREAVDRAAQMLDIPMYLAKTIEGLVSTDLSLDATRRSVFELGYSHHRTENDHFDDQGELRVASPLHRKIFGIQKINNETEKLYGYALMVIAGADGKVSERERNWYFDYFAKVSDTPQHIVDEVSVFDPQTADLTQILNKLKLDVPINFSKTLLYHSIRMSRADKHYALEEAHAVKRAARLLKLDIEVAKTLEYMVDAEDKVAKMRRTLFGIKN